MSNYNVGAYIRLSRDESYSDSDSIDNQIKLADYYCENNDRVSWGELADINNLVSDEEIFEEYQSTYFVEDDFSN